MDLFVYSILDKFLSTTETEYQSIFRVKYIIKAKINQMPMAPINNDVSSALTKIKIKPYNKANNRPV